MVWFTGLSGSGEVPTIARCVAERLRKRGIQAEVLDGDVIRNQLWPNWGIRMRIDVKICAG